MKALIQRVLEARVEVEDKIVGEIKKGILVYLGIVKGDTEEIAKKLAEKVVTYRIFKDNNNKMNKSLQDINGEILVVSQFTLACDCKKGRRPSFDKAMSPSIAKSLYENFIVNLEKLKVKKISTGIFGAYMKVFSINDGPVTFLLEV